MGKDDPVYGTVYGTGPAGTHVNKCALPATLLYIQNQLWSYRKDKTTMMFLKGDVTFYGAGVDEIS
jgi:hypothetical protein